MIIPTIVLFILTLTLVSSLPTWRHSAGWGYFPSGGAGVLTIAFAFLFAMGCV